MNAFIMNHFVFICYANAASVLLLSDTPTVLSCGFILCLVRVIASHSLLNLGIILYREIEAQLLIYYAFAQRPLSPGLYHIWIILFSADHLIATFQIKPVDNSIQRLG